MSFYVSVSVSVRPSHEYLSTDGRSARMSVCPSVCGRSCIGLLGRSASAAGRSTDEDAKAPGAAFHRHASNSSSRIEYNTTATPLVAMCDMSAGCTAAALSITVVFQASQPVNVRWMRVDSTNDDARLQLQQQQQLLLLLLIVDSTSENAREMISVAGAVVIQMPIGNWQKYVVSLLTYCAAIRSKLFSYRAQENKTRKPSCRWGRRATAYTVPVAVLTFMFIQG